MKYLSALLLFPTAAFALGVPSAQGPTNNMWGSVLLLLMILVVVAVFAKKYGRTKYPAGATLRVIGNTQLGGKERVTVLEINGQWLVLGVTPTSIVTLATYAAPLAIALPKNELESRDVTQSMKFPGVQNVHSLFTSVMERARKKVDPNAA